MSHVTPRQRAYLAAIGAFLKQRQYPPTFRDVQDAVGIASTNGASEMLVRLRKKGLVKWEPGEVRTLLLTQAGEEAISR
jgi:repressor LexA